MILEVGEEGVYIPIATLSPLTIQRAALWTDQGDRSANEPVWASGKALGW